MRIGVVSDTHDKRRNVARIVELFDAAGIERVVHTGDITRAPTLALLSRLSAPVCGVWGNNDLERDALEAAAHEGGLWFTDPPLVLDWADRRVVIVHDPTEHERGALPEHDVFLHGHTHRRVVERSDGRLVFNPGECAGFLDGHNAVGVLDLGDLEVEILRF